MLREVWKNYNVSCVMVLPLFNTITDDIRYKNTAHTGYPFTQLCIDYDLEDTYLYADESKEFDGYLYLCFNSDLVTKNLSLTNSKYYSLFEMIVDSGFYSSDNLIKISDSGKIIIPLKVPKRFYKDIKKIEKSQYSKLSKAYKNEIKIKCKRIPQLEGVISSIGSYISKSDLAYAISVRGIHVKEELEKFLNTKIHLDSEVYPVLNKNNEVLEYKNIYKKKPQLK